MATATQHRKIHHPHRKTKTKTMKLQKMNSRMMTYVRKKPARTIGIATLFSALVIGAIFAKRYFNH